MHRSISFLVAALLLLTSSLSYGTTWVPEKVRDPVTNGRVKVWQPASSGSYIYHWPEKSDQIFWPYTDENWLWFNPKSGYIAFGNDFEELEPSKVEELRAWLIANFQRDDPPRSRLELLAWAERVYSIRTMSDDFWCYFFRLMAFETRADPKISLMYVRKALPMLTSQFETAQEASRRMALLYLLSEYNRRIGNENDATVFLEQLTSFEANDELADLKTYLLEIAREQRALGVASQ